MLKKEGGEMAKKGGSPENLRPVRSKEEAKKRGAKGGKKSGEVRRNKRDAKKAIGLLLNLAAKGTLEKNLETLGFDKVDMTNMLALQASLFTRAIAGDNQAYKMLMDYGGFNPDTEIKQKEVDQKVEESKSKIKYYESLGENPPGDSIDGEGKDDVIIYLPEQDSEGGDE